MRSLSIRNFFIAKELALFRSTLPAGAFRLQRVDDLDLAVVERLLAGFLHVEVNQHFVVPWSSAGSWRKLCSPARSMAARRALSLGVCENFT
jgi:hypothetical protein